MNVDKSEPSEAEFKVLWDAAIDLLRAADYERANEPNFRNLTETMHGIAEVCKVPTVQLTTQVHDFALTKYEED